MKELVITCWGRCVLYTVVCTTAFPGDTDTRLNHHPVTFVGEGTSQYQARRGHDIGLTTFHPSHPITQIASQPLNISPQVLGYCV